MLHIKYLYTTISGFLYPQPSTHSELCCSPRPEKRESDHITPLFQALHWLLIKQRIRYKINTLCYRCITCTAPSNLCDRLQLSTPSRTLRSASDTLSLQTSGIRLSTVCSQDISVFGPYTWNDLPLPLRKKKEKKLSLDSCKSNLKTFLFSKTIDPLCFPLSLCCLPPSLVSIQHISLFSKLLI